MHFLPCKNGTPEKCVNLWQNCLATKRVNQYWAYLVFWLAYLALVGVFLYWDAVLGVFNIRDGVCVRKRICIYILWIRLAKTVPYRSLSREKSTPPWKSTTTQRWGDSMHLVHLTHFLFWGCGGGQGGSSWHWDRCFWWNYLRALVVSIFFPNKASTKCAAGSSPFVRKEGIVRPTMASQGNTMQAAS